MSTTSKRETYRDLLAYADGYSDGRKDAHHDIDAIAVVRKAREAGDKAYKEFDIQLGQNIGRLGRALLDRMSRIERHLGLEAGALKTPLDPPQPKPWAPWPITREGNRVESLGNPEPKYEAQDNPADDGPTEGTPQGSYFEGLCERREKAKQKYGNHLYSSMAQESYTVRRASVEAKRLAQDAYPATPRVTPR